MLAGTPDEVRDQLREYESAGVDYMQINFMDFPDSESSVFVRGNCEGLRSVTGNL